MSHNYHPMCGCADCCRHESAEESREELVEATVKDWNRDDAKRREAEEWIAGTFDGAHYTEVTLALDELHRLGATPAVLEKLHALAKVESLALQAKLTEMAETEIDRLDDAA